MLAVAPMPPRRHRARRSVEVEDTWAWKAWGISGRLTQLCPIAMLSLTSSLNSRARSRVEGPVAIGFSGRQWW
jgi:hypothetical protein